MAWLISQHVPAKRYLVAVDEAYFGAAEAGVGALPGTAGWPDERGRGGAVQSHPQAEDAVALRRWDEGAKDPARPGLPMADLLAAFDRYRMAQDPS